MARKIEKTEKAIAYLMNLHRRHDVTHQNEDAMRVRERRQIETLTRHSAKLREWLAVHPEKTNRRGEPLKSNITDNDSATMKTSHGVVQGYTGVAAVDARSQVVMHAEAFGTGQENALLPAVLEQVRENFMAIGTTDPLTSATALTDAGYHSEATLQQVADLGVDALIADTNFRSRDARFADAYQHKPKEKQRQPGEHRSKWFARADFLYDEAAKTCVCPNGKPLKLSSANVVIKGRRGVSCERCAVPVRSRSNACESPMSVLIDRSRSSMAEKRSIRIHGRR